MEMSWLYFGFKPVWPSFLFSIPLFLLEDQVLLFVSVYDLFSLPAVVRNSIGAMCHAMVMSWILAPSQPGPPPSLPQGYTLSLYLTFQINLLYCILCLENLLSTSFQPCKLWLWQYALLSKGFQTRPSILCVTHQMSRKEKLFIWLMNHKLYQLVLLMALDQYMAILSGTWWYGMLLSSAGSAEGFYACIY